MTKLTNHYHHSSSPRQSSETFHSILQCQRFTLWRLKREGLQLMQSHQQVLSIGAFMLKMVSWRFLLILSPLGISSGYYFFYQPILIVSERNSNLPSLPLRSPFNHQVKLITISCYYLWFCLLFFFMMKLLSCKLNNSQHIYNALSYFVAGF